MSEIDDIFASKAKHKDLPLPPLPPSSKSSSKKDKKKKKKAAPSQHDSSQKDTDASAAVTPSPSKKRPAPEMVVDTSDHLVVPTKRHKGLPTQGEVKTSKSSIKADKKGLDEFKDSRGMGDRRTTEEGWLVYKEDELGIGDEGGDTPLCPFDCDCCF